MEPLDLDSLGVAVTIADARDAAGAAKALGLTRRTLLARIAGIERQVGAALFTAEGPRLQPTPAGEAFVGEARLALAAAARAGRLARAVAEREATVAIGVEAAALFGPVRDLLAAPAWAEAGLRPRILELTGIEQARALAEGRIAMGFLTPPVPALPRAGHRIVATSRWSAVVPQAEARLRKTASLAALARRPLVMPGRELNPLLRDGLLAALRATGAEPEIAQDARGWASVPALVALGLGSALVPSLVAKRMTAEGAAVLPLAEADGLPAFTLACLWLPQPAGTPAAEAIALTKAILPL